MIASATRFLRKLLQSSPSATPDPLLSRTTSLSSSSPVASLLPTRTGLTDEEQDDEAEGHVTKKLAKHTTMHSAESFDENEDSKEGKDGREDSETRIDVKTALSLLPSNLRVERKLASGSYSDVWRVVDNDTKKTLAVKTIHPGLAVGTNESAARRARRASHEDILWSKLDHENILRRHASYVCERCRATVMDYCNGGDLFRYLERNAKTTGSFRFADIRDSAHVIEQLFRALDYLHNKAHMMHRDVKPENILVQFEPISFAGFGAKRKFCESRLLLADFTFLTPVESPDSLEHILACGTREYVAPEVYREEKYGCAVDCWSAGIVCYECIEGEHPFVDDFGNECATQRALLSGKAMRPLKNKDARIREVYIMTCLLRKDPITRITAREVLDYCENSY